MAEVGYQPKQWWGKPPLAPDVFQALGLDQTRIQTAKQRQRSRGLWQPQFWERKIKLFSRRTHRGEVMVLPNLNLQEHRKTHNNPGNAKTSKRRGNWPMCINVRLIALPWWGSLLLIGSTFGCDQSNMQAKRESFNLIGTWKTSPMEGEWGLTQTVLKLEESGKIEVVTIITGPSNGEESGKGTYAIEGDTFRSDIINKGKAVKFKMENDHLIMYMPDGEVFDFVRNAQ